MIILWIVNCAKNKVRQRLSCCCWSYSINLTHSFRCQLFLWLPAPFFNLLKIISLFELQPRHVRFTFLFLKLCAKSSSYPWNPSSCAVHRRGYTTAISLFGFCMVVPLADVRSWSSIALTIPPNFNQESLLASCFSATLLNTSWSNLEEELKVAYD